MVDHGGTHDRPSDSANERQDSDESESSEETIPRHESNCGGALSSRLDGCRPSIAGQRKSLECAPGVGVSLGRDCHTNMRVSNISKGNVSAKSGFHWSEDKLLEFFKAFREHGNDCNMIAGAIGGVSAELVERLYKRNETYLSLAEEFVTAHGFLAAVKVARSTGIATYGKGFVQASLLHGLIQSIRISPPLFPFLPSSLVISYIMVVTLLDIGFNCRTGFQH